MTVQQVFLKAYNFIKKRLQHRCFPVKIAKCLRTGFFIEHLWWLLLLLASSASSIPHTLENQPAFLQCEPQSLPFANRWTNKWPVVLTLEAS